MSKSTFAKTSIEAGLPTTTPTTTTSSDDKTQTNNNNDDGNDEPKQPHVCTFSQSTAGPDDNDVRNDDDKTHF